jgi:hypothetical protein
MFSAEAYNVEMGVSNDLFPQKRDETPGCNKYANTPNDSITASNNTDPEADDIELFANFMNFLDQPTPSATVPGGATDFDCEWEGRIYRRRLRDVPPAVARDFVNRPVAGADQYPS